MFNIFKKYQSDKIIAQTRDNYNIIAKHFSDTRKTSWPEFERYKEFVKDGQNILDWGCGNGRFFSVIKNKKIRYFGVDISQGLLNEANKEFTREIENGKAHFICSDCENLEFPRDFFDVVFMIASFHHLPDKKTRLKLLEEVFEKMKSGGKLVISVWNLKTDWAKKKLKTSGWSVENGNEFFVPWKNQDGKIIVKRYYHAFSKEELVGLLEKTGFTVSETLTSKHGDEDLNGRNLILIAEKG